MLTSFLGSDLLKERKCFCKRRDGVSEHRGARGVSGQDSAREGIIMSVCVCVCVCLFVCGKGNIEGKGRDSGRNLV